jgi:hypothetical protein
MADIIIKTITPAISQDLMTLDELKTKLGITNTAQDASLQALITAYSDVIATLCNRVFGKETLMETWRDLDSNRIFLSHYPIATETDITSVESPRTTTILDPATDYEIELKSGKVELYATQSEPIVVTYTGGYLLPDEAPPALKEALAIMIRNERALAQQAAVSGVRSLSHKESRVVYFDPNAHKVVSTSASQMPMNSPVNALLMHYVRLQV